MGIKMIVTDLDRTLLQTDKRISEYSAKILDRCHADGIKVVFATARPKRTVSTFCHEVPVDALIINNGAAIYSDDRLIDKYDIAPEIRNHVLKSICHDYPETALSVEIDDMLYTNFDVSDMPNAMHAKRISFNVLPGRPADKIIVGVSSMQEVDTFSKYLPDDLYIEMNDGKLALIMNKAATKWNAVKKLMNHYGFLTSEIAAFGDDYNDLEMIKNCGIGVAMENALEEVKSISDYICGSNDEDGVARWIDKRCK